MITSDNAIPPDPDLIMESEDTDDLKRRAEALALEFYGLLEFVWFEGSVQDYMELTVDDQCRFVVRP